MMEELESVEENETWSLVDLTREGGIKQSTCSGYSSSSMMNRGKLLSTRRDLSQKSTFSGKVWTLKRCLGCSHCSDGIS
jgi:hypothetical protein